jgi:predicted nucleic acid-binding protein
LHFFNFNGIVECNIPYGITGQICQEVLQGGRTEGDYAQLKRYMETLTFYAPKDERDSFAEAARVYFDCRRKGITVRSSVDCLIAQIAREHGLRLLHNDKDLDNIKKVIPELQFY